MTTISPLPPPPDPSDSRTTFNSKAFAFWAAMPAMTTQINLVAGETNAASAAAASAQGGAEAAEDGAQAAQAAAAANAAAAAASAGASPWASGSYNAGVSARSTIDYRVYSARTTGSKPTDPSLDTTNWGLVSPNGLQLLLVTGTSQTAAVGGRYVLKNAAATTVTAPPSPQPGDVFAWKVGNLRTDNEINWNGANHEGVSDATMKLDGPHMAGEAVYIDATIGWGII